MKNRGLIIIILTAFASVGLITDLQARVLPDTDRSTINATLIRNLDEFDSHWGAEVGYCWRGRVDARLEARQDGMLGEDLWLIQVEAALIKMWGFMLEAGYHHTLHNDHRCDYNVIPVRLSFPFGLGDRLHVVPNATYWRVMTDDSDAIGFTGLDFVWDRRYQLGFELNVNQDFRYHNADLRFTYHW